jgi:hypothetical protein
MSASGDPRNRVVRIPYPDSTGVMEIRFQSLPDSSEMMMLLNGMRASPETFLQVVVSIMTAFA